MIDLVLVEDHQMVAEGLTAVWDAEPDIRVVGVAHDASSARGLIESAAPDVAVIDQRLPDGDGTALAEQVMARHPDVRVLLLTGFQTADITARARRVGVAGLVFKSAGIDELVDAVRGVSAGETRFPDGDVEGVVDAELSARELQVLSLVASGLPVATIASELELSPHTVRNHIRNILVKMGAHSKLEAVSMAVRAGMISLD